MKKIFIGYVLVIFSLQVFAQEKTYFDELFHKTSPRETPYFREYTLNQSVVSATDYDEGRICLEATISGLNDTDSVNEFIWYIRNQLAEFELKPHFKTLRGEFIFRKENGSESKALYNGQDLMYYHVSDSIGNQFLINGSGKYSQKSKLENELEYLIFRDSLLVDYISVRTHKQDTIYNRYDKMAEPQGGLQNFYTSLIKTLKYPFLKQLAGREARIYIQFVVDKNGQLTDFEALTPSVTRFETKTMEKLSKMPAWKPAVKNGKPVKTRFQLPVTFELR